MAPASKPKGGPRVKKEGKGDLYRIGGVDIPYDPELELDKPKPTPLFPVSVLQAPEGISLKNSRNTKSLPQSPSLPAKKTKLPAFDPFETAYIMDLYTRYWETMYELGSLEINLLRLSTRSRECQSIARGIRRRGG